MTKKDFELIARDIKNGEYIGNAFESRNQIAKRLASSLAKTNPRFNREKFLTACGVEIMPTRATDGEWNEHN